MNKKKFSKLLVKIGACDKAKDWVSDSNETNLKQLWLSCGRGNWMLWLLAKLDADRKKIVWSACQCARLSLQFVEDGEDRPRIAIETAERWCNGEATLEELGEAAEAAEAAAWDAAEAAAWAAADAARAAAEATEAAVWAATDAAEAARAAEAAAWGAAEAAEAARAETLEQCADIVRNNFEFEYVMELLKNA